MVDIDAPVMQRPERRPVADGDDCGMGQSLAHERVDHALGGLIERSGGLIKKKPIGLEKDGTDDG